MRIRNRERPRVPTPEKANGIVKKLTLQKSSRFGHGNKRHTPLLKTGLLVGGDSPRDLSSSPVALFQEVKTDLEADFSIASSPSKPRNQN